MIKVVKQFDLRQDVKGVCYIQEKMQINLENEHFNSSGEVICLVIYLKVTIYLSVKLSELVSWPST